MPDQRLVVLFDIDLTLIRNPIDREVIAASLDEATGVPGLLDRIDFSGRSDRWLVNEVSHLHGFDPRAVFDRYVAASRRLLPKMLATLSPSTLPGVIELLEVLRALPDTTLGIVTGNIRENAITKLTHGHVIEFFEPLRAGFGDDHDDPGRHRPRGDAGLRVGRGWPPRGARRHSARCPRRACCGRSADRRRDRARDRR